MVKLTIVHVNNLTLKYALTSLSLTLIVGKKRGTFLTSPRCSFINLRNWHPCSYTLILHNCCLFVGCERKQGRVHMCLRNSPFTLSIKITLRFHGTALKRYKIGR